MKVSPKIKFVSYFCFVYAVLHVFNALWLLGSDVSSEVIDPIIDVVLWAYIGYTLLKVHTKWSYWIAVALMGLVVLRFVVGSVLIVMAGIPSEPDMLTTLVIATIVFIFVLTSLTILAQKDVRAIYFTKHHDAQPS